MAEWKGVSKGELALDYVGRFIILAVAIAVISYFIWHIYIDVKGRDIIPKEAPEIKTDTIRQDEFSAKQIARYIEGCWSFAASGATKDAICYVLIGKMRADGNSVMAAIPDEMKKKVQIKADFSSGSISILLQNKGNMVLVN